MKRSIYPDLSKRKIIVASHVFASGPTQAVVKYLKEKNPAGRLLFIGHPLFPESPFLYLGHFFLTLFRVFQTKEKWDLFIGANSLNALAGVVLKYLGQVKKVVFYGVDYAPHRFENRLINSIYHLVDWMSILGADEVWSLSQRMAKARQVPQAKSKIVSMGVWLDEIKRAPFSRVKKQTLVFAGHLLEKQGVQLVIRAIPEIMKKIPDFHFLILGKGEYKSELQKLAEKENVTARITFAGYIEDHEKMAALISQSALAIAPYATGDQERNFTYYADPGKLKDYLAAGLPIILTDVPHNARLIAKAGCGQVVAYQKKAIAQAVIKMLADSQKLKKYRLNAIKLIQNYDWHRIYDQVFQGMIEK